VHYAKAAGLGARHLDAAHGDVSLLLGVHPEHQLVIHLVHVIAGEDNDVVGGMALDDVDVLIDRVGGAGVPLRLRQALAGWEDIEAFVAFRPEEVPTVLHVADQAVRLVLRRHADAADAGVHGIREREVDNA
jgi:hypothetical protein